MTELASVAARYANAVIQLAASSSADKIVFENLKTVNRVINATHDFGVVLKHPSVSPSEKKNLIISTFGGKVHELTLRLLELLADRRRLDLLPFIENEYEKLFRLRQNVVTGTLYFAEKPEDSVLSDIKDKLQKQLGKKLELDEHEDKSLIGGYVLRLGDQIIDGSLKGRLQMIEKQLLSV